MAVGHLKTEYLLMIFFGVCYLSGQYIIHQKWEKFTHKKLRGGGSPRQVPRSSPLKPTTADDFGYM